MARIVGLQTHEQILEITWDDGNRSQYLYEWLRDNCGCATCGNSLTGARSLRLTDFSCDIAPRDCEFDEHGHLIITWSQGEHVSRYATPWLREHCPELSAGRRSAKPQPWDTGIQDSMRWLSYASLAERSAPVVALVDELLKYGFVAIEHVPTEAGSISQLATMLGPVRSRSYAEVFDIWTRDNPDMLSNTRAPITPHVDEPFLSSPPGLFVMLCLQAAEDGGATVLVDGFELGRRLRACAPDAFETLCHTPLPYHRHRPNHFEHHAEAPVFRLDARGDVCGFRFAERSAAPLVLPIEQLQGVYKARRQLLELAYSPKLQLRMELRPGQALIVDNERLMHGREAFSGDRHLQQCNLDKDEVLSHYRMMRRQQSS